jgi:hypothetical protein
MGDGLICTLDPDFKPSTCDKDARFDMTSGRCVCNPGYAGSGEVTEETILAGISTCLKCSPFYTYKPGTRECTCKAGFIPGVDPETGKVADGFVCVRICPNGYVDDGSGVNCRDACPPGQIAIYGDAVKPASAAQASAPAPEPAPASAPEPSP